MKTIDDVLNKFTASADDSQSLTRGKTVTIWVSSEVKARYDELQVKSRRRFGKAARELLLELITAAEARTA
jgi:hypothetical protein